MIVMEIVLLNLGKTNEKSLNKLIEDYISRVSHFVKFSYIDLPDVKKKKNISTDRVKIEEEKVILNALNNSDYVVLLDEKGTMKTSKEFASWLDNLFHISHKRIVFITGGPYGFSDNLYKKADFMISLSKMTFTHEMVRLFFVEQLYRAFTIIKGISYHHD